MITLGLDSTLSVLTVNYWFSYFHHTDTYRVARLSITPVPRQFPPPCICLFFFNRTIHTVFYYWIYYTVTMFQRIFKLIAVTRSSMKANLATQDWGLQRVKCLNSAAELQICCVSEKTSQREACSSPPSITGALTAHRGTFSPRIHSGTVKRTHIISPRLTSAALCTANPICKMPPRWNPETDTGFYSFSASLILQGVFLSLFPLREEPVWGVRNAFPTSFTALKVSSGLRYTWYTCTEDI